MDPLPKCYLRCSWRRDRGHSVLSQIHAGGQIERALEVVRGRRAFTLVELLIVIGVIAFLVALALPLLSQARSSGGQTVSLSNLNQASASIEIYTQTYRDTFPWAPEGTPLLVAPAEEPDAWIQGSYWDLASYWPSLMHDVAPWREHFASWIGPGAVFEGAPWLRPGKQGRPSYELSHTFIARPELWDPTKKYEENAMRRPVQVSDVARPSNKVLLIDAELLHLHGAPIFLETPRPVSFADAHAAIKSLTDATPPPLLDHKPETRPAYDTPRGVRGSDFQ